MQLPTWFHGTPTEIGWYFLADDPDDWKHAKPVPVRKVEYASGKVEFQFRYICGTGSWRLVAELGNRLWFGPITLPAPAPDFELMSDAEQKACLAQQIEDRRRSLGMTSAERASSTAAPKSSCSPPSC